nr:ribonuclease H-like domain-containing protein [Tanacetum cinerariifolium]
MLVIWDLSMCRLKRVLRTSPCGSPRIFKRGKLLTNGGNKQNANFSFNNVEKWPSLNVNGNSSNEEGMGSRNTDDAVNADTIMSDSDGSRRAFKKDVERIPFGRGVDLVVEVLAIKGLLEVLVKKNNNVRSNDGKESDQNTKERISEGKDAIRVGKWTTTCGWKTFVYLEIGNGSLGRSMKLRVEYPWKPPVCSYCKVFGYGGENAYASFNGQRNTYGRGGFSGRGFGYQSSSKIGSVGSGSSKKKVGLEGDFNIILKINENSNGVNVRCEGMKEFVECIEDMEMEDINMCGMFYTWIQRMRNLKLGILKKLDRVIGNSKFISYFPTSFANFMPYLSSDHCPVILDMLDVAMFRPKSFRFMNFLADKSKSKEVVKIIGILMLKVVDPTLYWSLACSLQYLTFTRPDITYAVQQTGCPTTRRSTSGYYVFLGNNLLSCSSKRQLTLSRSSAEAEYRSVAKVVAETCWIRNLVCELYPLYSATIVYYDNVSAVYLSSNPVQHKRTKHIEIDIHFVRDLVATGQVCILHVPSRFSYAYIFTKGLPSALFDEFRDSLSVRCTSAPTAREY